MSRSGDESAARRVYRTLARLTNKRQAERIRDPSTEAVLHLSFASGRDIYAAPDGDGFFVVGYDPGGGLYLARQLNEGAITRWAKRESVDIQVDHDPQAKIRDALRGGDSG